MKHFIDPQKQRTGADAFFCLLLGIKRPASLGPWYNMTPVLHCCLTDRCSLGNAEQKRPSSDTQTIKHIFHNHENTPLSQR